MANATERSEHRHEYSVKPSAFDESNETIEAFIAQFERVAHANSWDNVKMAKVFPALLPSDCLDRDHRISIFS